MSLRAGQRVRPSGLVRAEIAKEGSGTIVKMDGDVPTVAWDGFGGVLRVREDPETLVVVDVKCSYAKEKWKRGSKWGVEGMIIVCDIHDQPANIEVYEVDDVSSVTSLCQRFPQVSQ